MDIWCPAPALMVTRVTGTLVTEGATAIEEVMLRRAAEDGRLLVFNDWEQMNDYEQAARTRLTEASRSILETLDGGHFLLRSRVVVFGVQVANAALRKLAVHPSRASFERSLGDALRERGPAV
ncbi:hypothetical protein [Sorangium cellulosum]|uniref:hypothetical protein n=1 Tax=Sorangium cellulosum TaxID=56 RepID=UPI001F482727|nr:hypothetical protein [Sorangium cellulosum]